MKVPVEFKEEIGAAKSVPRMDVDEGNIEELKSVQNVRPKRSKKIISPNETTAKRKPVQERWFYEPVTTAGDTPLDKDKRETAQATLFSSTSKTDDTEIGLNERLNMPTHLGTLEVLPESFLSNITLDEAGACSLQGVMFCDDELGWCRISG